MKSNREVTFIGYSKSNKQWIGIHPTNKIVDTQELFKATGLYYINETKLMNTYIFFNIAPNDPLIKVVEGAQEILKILNKDNTND